MYLAYCEDEEIQIEYIRQLVMQWALEKGVPLHFLSYRSAEELLFEQEGQYSFDVLLLDIDMRGMSGMELAHKIREKEKEMPIIFVTNRKEYVFEGYEVNAYRYLLKPLSEEKLFPLLDEINSASREEKRYIIESIEGEMQKIPLDNILYLEVNGHYTSLHTVNNYVLQVKKSLAELEEEIAGAYADDIEQEKKQFVSTHRSYLVNLQHVERVLRKECILSDGSSVPVSRNAYAAVNQEFIAFYTH